jgi:hypothetical protein
MIKINGNYFKRTEIRNGDMARPDKITATRQTVLNRASSCIIFSSQSEVSM